MVSWALGSAFDQGCWLPSARSDDMIKFKKKLEEYKAGFKIRDSLLALDLYDLINGGRPSLAVSKIQFDMDRIVHALTWLNGIKNWNKETFFKTLGLRVQNGVPADIAQLCSIDSIGVSRARKLLRSNIKYVRDVAHPANLAIMQKAIGRHAAMKAQIAAKQLIKG